MVFKPSPESGITSNGRFAVDREFEYIELVSSRGLGELFGPLGGSLGPLGGGSNISSTFVKIRVSTFRQIRP